MENKLRNFLLLLLMTCVAVFACSCVNEKPVSTEYGIDPDYDLSEYKGSEKTRYTLEDGERVDITDYVIGFRNAHALLCTDILTDLYGFEPYERPEKNASEDVVEYIDDEGRVLQLMVGKNTAFLDGRRAPLFFSVTRMGDIVGVSEDVFFLLDVNEINTSRYKDDVNIQLVR